MATRLKLKNAGRKESLAVAKAEVYYEKTDIDVADAPKLEAVKPGESVIVISRGRVISNGLREYGSNKDKPFVRVEVREVTAIPTPKAVKTVSDVNKVLAELEG